MTSTRSRLVIPELTVPEEGRKDDRSRSKKSISSSAGGSDEGMSKGRKRAVSAAGDLSSSASSTKQPLSPHIFDRSSPAFASTPVLNACKRRATVTSPADERLQRKSGGSAIKRPNETVGGRHKRSASGAKDSFTRRSQSDDEREVNEDSSRAKGKKKKDEVFNGQRPSLPEFAGRRAKPSLRFEPVAIDVLPDLASREARNGGEDRDLEKEKKEKKREGKKKEGRDSKEREDRESSSSKKENKERREKERERPSSARATGERKREENHFANASTSTSDASDAIIASSSSVITSKKKKKRKDDKDSTSGSKSNNNKEHRREKKDDAGMPGTHQHASGGGGSSASATSTSTTSSSGGGSGKERRKERKEGSSSTSTSSSSSSGGVRTERDLSSSSGSTTRERRKRDKTAPGGGRSEQQPYSSSGGGGPCPAIIHGGYNEGAASVDGHLGLPNPLGGSDGAVFYSSGRGRGLPYDPTTPSSTSSPRSSMIDGGGGSGGTDGQAGSGNGRSFINRPGDHRLPQHERVQALGLMDASDASNRYRSPSAPPSLVGTWVGRKEGAVRKTHNQLPVVVSSSTKTKDRTSSGHRIGMSRQQQQQQQLQPPAHYVAHPMGRSMSADQAPPAFLETDIGVQSSSSLDDLLTTTGKETRQDSPSAQAGDGDDEIDQDENENENDQRASGEEANAKAGGGEDDTDNSDDGGSDSTDSEATEDSLGSDENMATDNSTKQSDKGSCNNNNKALLGSSKAVSTTPKQAAGLAKPSMDGDEASIEGGDVDAMAASRTSGSPPYGEEGATKWKEARSLQKGSSLNDVRGSMDKTRKGLPSFGDKKKKKTPKDEKKNKEEEPPKSDEMPNISQRKTSSVRQLKSSKRDILSVLEEKFVGRKDKKDEVEKVRVIAPETDDSYKSSLSPHQRTSSSEISASISSSPPSGGMEESEERQARDSGRRLHPNDNARNSLTRTTGELICTVMANSDGDKVRIDQTKERKSSESGFGDRKLINESQFKHHEKIRLERERIWKDVTTWQDLPSNYMSRVCYQLMVRDLLSLAQVCRRWKTYSEDSALWRERYIVRWPSLKEKPSSNWKESYMHRLRYTLEKGVTLFNSVEASKGISYLIQEGHIEGSSNEIARLLLRFDKMMGRTKIQSYLNENPEIAREYKKISDQILKAQREQRMSKQLDLPSRWFTSLKLHDYSVLPQQLARRILQFLGPGELMHVAMTCKRWKEIADEDELWKEVYREWLRVWSWDCQRLRRVHPHSVSPNRRWKNFFLKNSYRDQTQGYKILRGEPGGLQWSEATPRFPQGASNVKTGFIRCNPPTQLFRHTAAAVGDIIYVLGGHENNGFLAFDTRDYAWYRPQSTGSAPESYQGHTCCAIDDKLFVFGGGHGYKYFQDLYIFDTSTLVWTRTEQTGDIPGECRGHSATAVNADMYILGGGNGIHPLDDIHILNTKTLIWQKLALPDPFVSRDYLTATTVGKHVVCHGGTTGSDDIYSDVRVLHSVTKSWDKERALESSSVARFGHTATKVGHWLFIFGGSLGGDKCTNDLSALNLETMVWYKTQCLGQAPSDRSGHTATLVGERLYVIGGSNGNQQHNDVHVLDFSAFVDVLINHQKLRKKSVLINPIQI